MDEMKNVSAAASTKLLTGPVANDGDVDTDGLFEDIKNFCEKLASLFDSS